MTPIQMLLRNLTDTNALHMIQHRLYIEVLLEYSDISSWYRYMINQMLPPTIPMMTKMVKILAPALSAVVIGFDLLGPGSALEPALGSDVDVPPVVAVRGAI